MHLFDFHVRNDDWPLVSSNDELVIVHRDAIAVNPILFIGAHQECTVEVRSALDREAVELSAPWTTFSLPAGGMRRLDLPGTGNPLHVVSKLTPTRGAIFVAIASLGVYDAYFKQVNVVSI